LAARPPAGRRPQIERRLERAPAFLAAGSAADDPPQVGYVLHRQQHVLSQLRQQLIVVLIERLGTRRASDRKDADDLAFTDKWKEEQRPYCEVFGQSGIRMAAYVAESQRPRLLYGQTPYASGFGWLASEQGCGGAHCECLELALVMSQQGEHAE